MSRTFLRVLSGAAGLITILAAIFYSLLFLSYQFQEAESAHLWTNYPRIGLAIGIMMALAFAALAGFLTYLLLAAGARIFPISYYDSTATSP